MASEQGQHFSFWGNFAAGTCDVFVRTADTTRFVALEHRFEFFGNGILGIVSTQRPVPHQFIQLAFARNNDKLVVAGVREKDNRPEAYQFAELCVRAVVCCISGFAIYFAAIFRATSFPTGSAHAKEATAQEAASNHIFRM